MIKGELDFNVIVGKYRLSTNHDQVVDDGILVLVTHKDTGEVEGSIGLEGFGYCRIMKNLISGNTFIQGVAEGDWVELRLQKEDVTQGMLHRFLTFSDKLGEAIKYYEGLSL